MRRAARGLLLLALVEFSRRSAVVLERPYVDGYGVRAWVC
jgi:hypothetical protein